MKFLAPVEPQDTMLAATAYPFWFFAFPYVFLTEKKEEPFVKFHTLQASFLGLALSALAFFVTLILFFVFRAVPSYKTIIESAAWTNYMGQSFFFMFLFCLYCLFLGICFCVVFYYASKAWNGEDFRIPFIGSYIEKNFFKDFVE